MKKTEENKREVFSVTFNDYGKDLLLYIALADAGIPAKIFPRGAAFPATKHRMGEIWETVIEPYQKEHGLDTPKFYKAKSPEEYTFQGE